MRSWGMRGRFFGSILTSTQTLNTTTQQHNTNTTPTKHPTQSQGVVNQKFDEEPRYEAYMKLFEVRVVGRWGGGSWVVVAC